MGQARQWTREEEERLAEEWGMYSIGTLAKRFERSESAIKERASRLKLGPHLKASDLISVNEFYQAFGYVSTENYKHANLKAAGFPTHRHRVQNNSFEMVDIEEFWEFAEKNRHLFDFSRLEEYTFGIEPEWVKAKRAEDWKRRMMVKPTHAAWTEAEDRELRDLLRQHRYTYPEIAQRLYRSEGAIQRRMQDLSIKERPIKAGNQDFWTDEQLRTVCEMIKAGASYESISRAVGKSAKATRGKVFNMYLTENLNKVAQLIGDGNWGDNRPDRNLKQRLLMTVEEKKEVKELAGRLASLLTVPIRKHFDDEDNWQRHLCRHWHDVKGCTAGGVSCDECDYFERIRPQNCVRCGVTFFERKENRMCERCRLQRKKQAAYKYMRRMGAKNGTNK